MGCMLVLSLACVGLALVPTNAYWLLMVLRCLQAAGSASTIALGAGVIADIATRSERGGFFGLFSMGPMVRLQRWGVYAFGVHACYRSGHVWDLSLEEL